MKIITIIITMMMIVVTNDAVYSVGCGDRSAMKIIVIMTANIDLANFLKQAHAVL